MCEYKTTDVYPITEKPEHEQMHQTNSAGSYIVETAYNVKGKSKLCFETTNQFHHPGRNHARKNYNLKLKGPYQIRGKWRVGFLAVGNIGEAEELCYDYQCRDEEWMKKGKLVEGRVVAGVTEGNKEKTKHFDGHRSTNKRQPGHQQYCWCPIQGCPSGPVQKITQHLANVHKLKKDRIRKLTLNKRFAPPEAVKGNFQTLTSKLVNQP